MSEASTPASELPELEPKLDREKLAALYARLQGEQSIVLALIGGFVASLAGALIWAAITAATKYQIGWMAVGVGFLVGFAVRVLGRGVTKPFGMIGAVMSLFGCLLGNLLGVCVIVAQDANISVLTIVSNLNFDAITTLMVQTFHPMDLLFYGIAVYEGYRFSFRPITDDEFRTVAANA